MILYSRLLLSLRCGYSGFCRLLLSCCRRSGGRTRVLAPLNALVNTLLAKAVSPSVWQRRPYRAQLARRLRHGGSLDGNPANAGTCEANWTCCVYVLCAVSAVTRNRRKLHVHIGSPGRAKWVARPRRVCPGCRRSTSGSARSQCRTSLPSPSERSPDPTRVRWFLTTHALVAGRPSNILEWHFVITGPADSPFENGQYHGKLVFPSEYPYKPPAIMILTPK